MDQTIAQEAPDAALALCARLTEAGYRRVDPPILQPTAAFLDLSGEDIRARIYLTSDAAGVELCLRPEFTIPVCRAYLASPLAGRQAQFSACGPVFRQRQGEAGEFAQAGLESFGRPDREAADAEILAIALEAAAAGGLDAPQVTIGDAGLHAAFLDGLGLPAPALRRLKRGLARGEDPGAILAPAANGTASGHAGVIAALQGVDQKGARALVEDLLSIAGIASLGGRGAGEIAGRFLAQAEAGSAAPVADEQRRLIETFLSISGDPDAALVDLRALADDAGLDLGARLDAFDARTGFLAARGLDVATLRFSAAFSRRLDYYTGFVFEARRKDLRDAPVAVGGGRYDGLLRALGATEDIPAVGAAIWVDRLAAGSAP